MVVFSFACLRDQTDDHEARGGRGHIRPASLATPLSPTRPRARRTPARLQATGPVANVVNVVVFLALYLTPEYAPALWFTSDAALLFYGTSMLLAAVRGYAGCEVLAASNWLLRRDDQVGCVVFSPVDHAERRLAAADAPDRLTR